MTGAVSWAPVSHSFAAATLFNESDPVFIQHGPAILGAEAAILLTTFASPGQQHQTCGRHDTQSRHSGVH